MSKAWWLLLMLILMLMLPSAPALAQDPAAGRILAATCANCHGTDGRPKGTAMPPLAGMKADVMRELLADYRSGRQPGTVMPQIVKGYSEDELRLIAAYFAAQARP